MDAKDYLKGFFTEHWKYMTVNTACKLNLFDAISPSGNSLEELCQSLVLPKETLKLLLDALISINFIYELI